MEVAPATRPAPWDRIGLALVTLAIVATIFNDIPAFLPVGEMANDAFTYVAVLLFLYFARLPGTITLPIRPLLIVIGLYVVIILGIGINYSEISTAWFKGRSGFGRVITQAVTITFGLLVTVLFYNLTLRGFLPAISRGARIGLGIMAGVGLLEFASWYGIPGLTQAHVALSQVIHANSGGEYGARLRSTAFEVSWTGAILTFLFPFALLDLPRHDLRRLVCVALVGALVVLARSRTAMLVIGGQGLLLAWASLRGRFDRFAHLVTLACLAALLLFLIPQVREAIEPRLANMIRTGSFVDASRVDSANVSNATRLAAINAGTGMFEDHPLLGVGLGQYGFDYPKYLQAADYLSWEVRKYATEAESDWPPIFSLHIRILAELGILGYALWVALIGPPLFRSLRAFDPDTPLGRAHLAVAMTLAGWMLLGLSIDSFRFFGGWIALGVGLALPAAARTAPAG